MKKKIKYADEPMETGEILYDFLPSPEELVFKNQMVNVTSALRKQLIRNLATTIKMQTIDAPFCIF